MGDSSDEDIPRARKKVRRRETTVGGESSSSKLQAGSSKDVQKGGGEGGGGAGAGKEVTRKHPQAPPVRLTAPVHNTSTNTTLQRRPGVRAPPPNRPLPLPSPPSSPSSHAKSKSKSKAKSKSISTSTKQSVNNSLPRPAAAPLPPPPPRPVTPPPLPPPTRATPPPGSVSAFLASTFPPNPPTSSSSRKKNPKPKSYATKPRPVPVRPPRGPSFSDAEQEEEAAIAQCPPTRNGAEQRVDIVQEGAEKKFRNGVLGANRRGRKREEKLNLEEDGRGGERECPRLKLDDGRRSPQLHFANSRPSKRPRVHAAPSFPTARSILKPSTSRRTNDAVSSPPEMQPLSTITALAMNLQLPEGVTVDLLDGRRGIKRKRGVGGAATLPEAKSAKLVVVGASNGQGTAAAAQKKKSGRKGVPQLEMMEVEDGPLTPPPEREDRFEERHKRKKEKEKSSRRRDPLPTLAAPPPRTNAVWQTVPLPPRPKGLPTPPVASDSVSPVNNAQLLLPTQQRRQPSDSIESFPSPQSNPKKQKKANKPLSGKPRELPLQVVDSSSGSNVSRTWEGKQKKKALTLYAVEGGEPMDEEGEEGENGAERDAFVDEPPVDDDQNQHEDEDAYAAYLEDDSFFSGVDMDFDGDAPPQQQHQQPVVDREVAQETNGPQEDSSPLDGPISSPSNGPLKKGKNPAVNDLPRTRLFPMDQVMDRISSSLSKKVAVEEEIEEIEEDSSREGSREEAAVPELSFSPRAGKEKEKVVLPVVQDPPSDRRSSLRSSTTSATSASTTKIISTTEKRKSKKDVVAEPKVARPLSRGRSSRRIVAREPSDTMVPATPSPPPSPLARVSSRPPADVPQPLDPSNHSDPPVVDASSAEAGPSKPARLSTSSVVASVNAPPPSKPGPHEPFLDRAISITNRTFSISSIQTHQRRSSAPLPPGMDKDDFEFVTGTIGSTRRRGGSGHVLGHVLKSSLRRGPPVSTGSRRGGRSVSFATAPLPSPTKKKQAPHAAPAPPILRPGPSPAVFPPPAVPSPQQKEEQRTPVKRIASLSQLALPSFIPATATPPSVIRRSPSSSSLARKGSRRLSEILVPASSLSPYFSPKPKQQRVEGGSKSKPIASSSATKRLPPPPPLLTRSASSSSSGSKPAAIISFPRTKSSTQPSKPSGLRSSSPALPSSPLGGGPSSTSRTSPRFVASITTTRKSPRILPASSSSSSSSSKDQESNRTGGVRSSEWVDVDVEDHRVGGWKGGSAKASSSTVAAGEGGDAGEESEEHWEPSQDDFFASVVEPPSRVRGRAGVGAGVGRGGGVGIGAGVGSGSKRPLGRRKRVG
ncbi:hypothetical protein BDY24DRAFT_376960 [Mrakia frigida]|uniref:uncharacterized protein n=1 Tax=Mrakia frigida TaxID=29902 RepID=UPI003FCC2016